LYLKQKKIVDKYGEIISKIDRKLADYYKE
jgi:hypothetical protein